MESNNILSKRGGMVVQFKGGSDAGCRVGVMQKTSCRSFTQRHGKRPSFLSMVSIFLAKLFITRITSQLMQ